MLGNRLGDVVASVPLIPLDPTTVGIIPAASVLGGRPIVNQRDNRAAQANIAALSVTGGSGTDTLAAKFQESDPPAISDNINAYDGTDDGSEKLRDAGASNVEFGIPFTTSRAQTIYSVKLQLSRLGSPTAGKSVWVAIQTDAAGDPSGTVVGGTSRKILATSISTSLNEVTFFFDVGVDLAITTPYWIVISGDYTASLTNCIQVHYNTVAGTSGCKHFDAAWSAADVNIDYWYRIEYLVFTDISATYDHATITEGWLNIFDTVERIEIPLAPLKDTLRAKYTTTGTGTWSIGHTLSVGFPKVLPLV